MKRQWEDTYVKKDTYVTAKAVITVYSPVLTEEERDRRYKEIKEAAAGLLLATWRAKAQQTEPHGE